MLTPAGHADCPGRSARQAGEFRDIPLPRYVVKAIDKHLASHGTTDDGYLFRGRTVEAGHAGGRAHRAAVRP
jgi:hypothetical protein